MTAIAKHLGLDGRPFRLEPDPELFFDCRAQREALTHLMAIMAKGSRLAVITGEAGVGKTMLARLVEKRLQTASLPIFHVRADDALAVPALESGFGMRRDAGRNMLVVVDEAQRLSSDRLEKLAGMSKVAGLHIVLLGRPELLDRLRDRRSAATRHALAEAFVLRPLGSDEIEPYVHHRLRNVGWRGDAIMTDSARDRLFLASGGLPRQVGRICARALSLAAIDGRPRLTGEVIADAVAEVTRAAEHRPGENAALSSLHDRIAKLHDAIERERARTDLVDRERRAERHREAEQDIATARRLLRWLTRIQQESRR